MKKISFFVILIGILVASCDQKNPEDTIAFGNESRDVYDTVTFTTVYPVELVEHLNLEIKGKDTTILHKEKLIAIKENYGIVDRYLYFTEVSLDSSLISLKTLPTNYCLVIKALAMNKEEYFPKGTVLSFSVEKIVNHQGG